MFEPCCDGDAPGSRMIGARHRGQFGPAQRILMLAQSSQYFVGWGTLSLVNAGLAQGKGRSGLNWWLMSLLLGPVATLLIVFLDPVPRSGS